MWKAANNHLMWTWYATKSTLDVSVVCGNVPLTLEPEDWAVKSTMSGCFGGNYWTTRCEERVQTGQGKSESTERCSVRVFSIPNCTEPVQRGHVWEWSASKVQRIKKTESIYFQLAIQHIGHMDEDYISCHNQDNWQVNISARFAS